MKILRSNAVAMAFWFSLPLGGFNAPTYMANEAFLQSHIYMAAESRLNGRDKILIPGEHMWVGVVREGAEIKIIPVPVERPHREISFGVYYVGHRGVFSRPFVGWWHVAASMTKESGSFVFRPSLPSKRDEVTDENILEWLLDVVITGEEAVALDDVPKLRI